MTGNRFYDYWINIVIIISIAMLFFQQSRLLLPYNDLISEVIFLVYFFDFFYNLYINKNFPKRYVFSLVGIIDFLAIVGNPIVKIFRLLGTPKVSFFWTIMKKVIVKEKDNLVGILLWISILVFAAGYFIYSFEAATNPLIQSPFDAIYYTMVAMSTAGFGDIYCITIMGKILTMALILIGNSIFVIFPMIISIGFYDEMKKVKFQDIRRRSFEGPEVEAKVLKEFDFANHLDKIDMLNIIDVRRPSQFYEAHIKGAKNVPAKELIRHPETYIKKDRPYHIICNSGRTSGDVCRALQEQGYARVYSMKGGTILASELGLCKVDVVDVGFEENVM